jgi:hypothetical protein
VAEVRSLVDICRSETQLAAELNDAGRRGLSNKAKLRITYGIINGSVASRSSDQQATHVPAVLVMVEDVEGIRF